MTGNRLCWRDTEKKQLEAQLNKFIAGLITFAGRLREYEDEQERKAEVRRAEAARQKEEANRRAERRRRVDEERARVDQLFKEAESWNKSHRLRKYIHAVRQSSESLQGEEREEALRWIEWATQQAQRLDPLCPSPPSILDESTDDS